MQKYDLTYLSVLKQFSLFAQRKPFNLAVFFGQGDLAIIRVDPAHPVNALRTSRESRRHIVS